LSHDTNFCNMVDFLFVSGSSNSQGVRACVDYKDSFRLYGVEDDILDLDITAA
jgi:hypothetical protein